MTAYSGSIHFRNDTTPEVYHLSCEITTPSCGRSKIEACFLSTLHNSELFFLEVVFMARNRSRCRCISQSDLGSVICLCMDKSRNHRNEWPFRCESDC